MEINKIIFFFNVLTTIQNFLSNISNFTSKDDQTIVEFKKLTKNIEHIIIKRSEEESNKKQFDRNCTDRISKFLDKYFRVSDNSIGPFTPGTLSTPVLTSD